jgi:hypothetical protein
MIHQLAAREMLTGKLEPPAEAAKLRRVLWKYCGLRIDHRVTRADITSLASVWALL